MKTYLKEKIGDPALFTGRKKELDFLLKWVDKIKREIGPSRSMLARRKTGKTAILQRLFNIVFERNDQVIPFYYEVGETDQWCVHYCRDFFLTFIYHYTAFRSRNTDYLSHTISKEFDIARAIVKKEGLDFLVHWVDEINSLTDEENTDILWSMVRDAPRNIAQKDDMRVLQIIDEFQYLNGKIYRDKETTHCIERFAQAYMSTAEYKNAPLLVSGSWVGWLMGDLLKMPARFRLGFLENMPENEAEEIVLKYSLFEDVPVTADTVHLIATLAEGNPFYITALLQSDFPDKDLTTRDGVLAALEFETLNKQGNIRGTWLEYIDSAFTRVNKRNAKNFVLYLSKHRERQVSRKEIRETLVPDMDDYELEKKLKALAKSDGIEEGRSNFYFQGVKDNIFDKVFRGKYAEDIEAFDPAEITAEYKALFEKIRMKYKQLSGEYGHFKGKFAEFIIIRHLARRAYKENRLFKSMLKNLPEDFRFDEYESVWSWSASPIYKQDVQVDIFAHAKKEGYSLIGEVKNREKIKFSHKEAVQFKEKADVLMKLEGVPKAQLVVISPAGFTETAIACFKENKMAWSDDKRWMDN